MRASGACLSLPFERRGALVVAWTDAQAAALPAIQQKAVKNGVLNVKWISAQQLRVLEPNLSTTAKAALLVPGLLMLRCHSQKFPSHSFIIFRVVCVHFCR